MKTCNKYEFTNVCISAGLKDNATGRQLQLAKRPQHATPPLLLALVRHLLSVLPLHMQRRHLQLFVAVREAAGQRPRDASVLHQSVAPLHQHNLIDLSSSRWWLGGDFRAATSVSQSLHQCTIMNHHLLHTEAYRSSAHV